MMNRYAVSVIGLGYVGLPLASLLAENHDVTGFDVDSSRINDLQNSNLPVDEPGLPEYFISGLKNKSLKLTANPHEIRKTLIKIVTVGTPPF